MSTAEAEPETSIAPAVEKLSEKERFTLFVKDADEFIASVDEKYGSLRIGDVSNKEEVQAVTDAHRIVRTMRLDCQKTCKALKVEPQAFINRVNETDKRLLNGLKPQEDRLKSERDKVDAEKARIKAEKAEAEQRETQARIQKRVDALTPVNGDVSDLAALAGMSDNAFAEVLRVATELHELAKVRQANTDEAEAVRAELLKYGQIIELDKVLELDKPNRILLIDSAKQDHQRAEAERVAKEEADRIEREKLEAANRKQQEELAQLRKEKEEREAAERAKTEAEETAKRAAEAAETKRLKAEADAKVEKGRKAREEALRPERVQLVEFAALLDSVEIPKGLRKHETALKQILGQAASQIQAFATGLK